MVKVEIVAATVPDLLIRRGVITRHGIGISLPLPVRRRGLGIDLPRLKGLIFGRREVLARNIVPNTGDVARIVFVPGKDAVVVPWVVPQSLKRRFHVFVSEVKTFLKRVIQLLQFRGQGNVLRNLSKFL